MKRIFIYGLFSKSTGKCRYVGQTRNMKARGCAHRSNNTIREDFEIKILEVVAYSKANKAERKWIIEFRNQGSEPINKHLPNPVRTRFKTNEIRKRIAAGKSFWVPTKTERVQACSAAKSLGIKYATGSDERGGFYIIRVPKVEIPTIPTK